MKVVFEKARFVLESGGIIAFKTDTVMGLGVNGFNRAAVKKLFDLKKRDYNKPVSLLTYSVSKIFEYTLIPEYAFRIINLKFPGALTCIMKSKGRVYTTPQRAGNTLGIRIPNAIKLLEFLALLPFPIVATSANFSGLKTLTSKEDVMNVFSNAIHYLDFGYNIKMSGVASTVADCSGRTLQILREGSIKL